MIENIYDTLQTQYKKLTDEEKNAILVYKSFLFYHINEIASIPNYEDISPSNILEKIKKPEEFIYQYENFKNIIKQPQNITIKYTVFGKINITSIEQFIESLKKIIQILNNTKYKIMVNTPIITYRGISSKTPIQDISKSNLVSTSLTIETADKFLFASKKIPIIRYTYFK